MQANDFAILRDRLLGNWTDQADRFKKRKPGAGLPFPFKDLEPGTTVTGPQLKTRSVAPFASIGVETADWRERWACFKGFGVMFSRLAKLDIPSHAAKLGT